MKPVLGGSFRAKIAGVTVGTGLLSLLLSCGAFVLIDRSTQLDAIEENLETLAAIFAYGTTAAVEFSDQRGATDVLDGLRAAPEISWAVVFDHEGEPFAVYRKPEIGDVTLPKAVPEDGVSMQGQSAIVARGIELDRERIGTFVAQFSLRSVQRSLMAKAAIVVAAFALAGLLALLIATRLIHAVTRPILDLAKLATEVTATQDYSRRADQRGKDEVSGLASALNAMLARIESDKDLYAQREKLRAINSELTREKERALAAVRAKSEFLANMSHEIRTPMTAILGYVDLLRTEEVDRTQAKQMLDVIQRNGKHLVSVINDILDLSKLESGKLVIEALDCSPDEVLGDAAALLRERAVEKGVAFEVELRGRIPASIRTDPTRLRQILLNLMSNALKFTSDGYVRTTAEVVRIADRAVLRFLVEDTGIGIAANKHDAVFQAFAQADSSTTRRFGGTGLGLSISARLAGLLGGRLELVWSAPGRGSAFALDLPLPADPEEQDFQERELSGIQRSRVPQAPATEAPLPENLSGRVLVAEDSLDNQRLVGFMLKKAGLAVDVAVNGRIALELVAAAQEADTPYDVILMDMQMPEIDGYEATQRLRSDGYTGPIIAFTAHAMTGERERCIGAGCDGYISKPIDRAELLRTLQHHLSSRKTDPS